MSEIAAAALAGALATGYGVLAGRATERIVVDWNTGIAIGGYDPVAYFIDGKQSLGSADIELPYKGGVWRFTNPGNRAAFAADPEIYLPQFGGYDPIAIAMDAPVAGKPTLWFIAGERLFLFYDTTRLKKFELDSDRAIAEADRHWPSVLETLSR